MFAAEAALFGCELVCDVLSKAKFTIAVLVKVTLVLCALFRIVYLGMWLHFSITKDVSLIVVDELSFSLGAMGAISATSAVLVFWGNLLKKTQTLTGKAIPQKVVKVRWAVRKIQGHQPVKNPRSNFTFR